ncbi:F-box/LRR-repeat protein 20-like isoform X1 [Clytia hemisphaerica]|uniref:F-box domain-containing protein n=1 Tax=Clytia hemisphaerica TaxID=252671 RepID=A0A7M5ULY1_9CNID|eukprot:TCONS_00037604-protein
MLNSVYAAINQRTLAIADRNLATYGLNGQLPSDTDDEDYIPSGEPSAKTNKRKRKMTRKVISTSEDEDGDSIESDHSEEKEEKPKAKRKKKKLTPGKRKKANAKIKNADDDEKPSTSNSKKKKGDVKKKSTSSATKKTKAKATNNKPDEDSTSTRKKSNRSKLLFGADRGSDDSEDEDYVPEGGRPSSKPTVKKKSNRINKSDTSIQNKTFNNGGTSLEWAELPIEILSMIFRFITATESKGVRYILRCSQVCQHWRNVVNNEASWFDIDLSFVGPSHKERKITRILSKICPIQLVCVRSLSLSGWCELTDEGLDHVSENCTKIEKLDLSSCQKSVAKLTSSSLLNIAENCTELQKLNVSNLRVNSYNQIWSKFLQIRGAGLISMNFSNNIPFSNTCFKLITDNCPLLKILDCSNTGLRSLSLQEFQTKCPLLEELYLANVNIVVRRHNNELKTCPGFDHLSLVSFASQNFNCWVTDEVLNGFLKSAISLKTLDIRGAKSVYELDMDIAATSLERLYISDVPLNEEITEAICER